MRVSITLAILTTFAACEQVQDLAPTGVYSSPIVTQPGCYDPAAYGAIPGDDLSDRVAIQAAADAASLATGPQVVCLGPGTWDCSRAPINAYNRASCVSVHRGNVTFSGAGRDVTTLRLAGDQGNADIVMISHDPGSAGGVTDMTLDTTGTYNTSEQTHTAGTTGLCAAPYCTSIGPLTYQRLTIVHPRPPDGRRKGDGIRLLGNTPATAIHDALIDDVRFISCARSCIQPQRGVHGLVIRNSEFWADQPIHGESTGGTAPLEDEDADIHDNIFHATDADGRLFQGDYDIALSGPPGSGPYDRIRIHGNTGARGYYLYRTSNAEVYDTTILATMKTPTGIIEVSNQCDDISIHDVTLQRSGLPGPVIRLTSRDTSICSGAQVVDSLLIQGTAGHGVHAESADGLLVDRVTMAWLAPAPAHAGVWARAITAPMDDVMVRDTWFHGPVGYAVQLSAAPSAFHGARVLGSYGRGVAKGLSCIGAGGFGAGVEYAGSALGPMSCTKLLP